MALISDKSHTRDIDHTDAIDPDDHVAPPQIVKNKQEILAQDNGPKLTLAEKMKNREVSEPVAEKPAEQESHSAATRIEPAAATPEPRQASVQVIDADKKIKDTLAGAQDNLLNQVRQMMESTNEASKVASLLEMAKRMIEAIIRMIENMLVRLGFIKSKKDGEQRQEQEGSKEQSDLQTHSKAGNAGQSESAKDGETTKLHVADSQSTPAAQTTTAPSNSVEVASSALPAVAPEIADRLEQAETLINSIAGLAGEMLGKFLSDPFVQRHAERGDRPATVSALCDRALEVCRQDLANASAMVRELTADISGTDAQRLGLRPREAAQLILEGGIDPALINPKLKSKATLLMREYAPLADRLGAIRQAVGIIVADTVLQAEGEGAASTEILKKTLESLKSKLKILGGGDDMAITRLGLDDSFRAVGAAHIAMNDQVSTDEITYREPEDETTPSPIESAVSSEIINPSSSETAETEISQPQEQNTNVSSEIVPEPTAQLSRFQVAANEEDFIGDGTTSETTSSEDEKKGDHDRPRG